MTSNASGTNADLATQVDIVSLLNGAATDALPRIEIPADMVKFFDQERATFAARTNRFKRTMVIKNVTLARVILTGRRDDLKLTGDALFVAAAKHFARMLRQYAEDHDLSTTPRRDPETPNVVVYRLAKPKPKANPVTVTQTPAETPAG